MAVKSKKLSISLGKTALEYLDKKAEEVGTSRSGMVAFMIESYRKQEEAMTATAEMIKLQQLLQDKKD